MGTFHERPPEQLHGITVVVDTHGSKVFIGRCEVYLKDQHILLNESDEHDEAGSDKTKSEYITHASKVGFWRKHDRILIKADEIAQVTPLNEIL